MEDRRPRGIEKQIHKAVQEGSFDNLRGKGKPLNLSANPHADPEWEMANKLLKDAGFAPDFIEIRKEIEERWTNVRDTFLQVKAWYNGLAEKDKTAVNRSEYIRQRAVFEMEAAKTNKKIADYNLSIPADVFWRAPVNPNKYLD